MHGYRIWTLVNLDGDPTILQAISRSASGNAFVGRMLIAMFDMDNMLWMEAMCLWSSRY